jgi:predicted AAA+ superfamily ATPase
MKIELHMVHRHFWLKLLERAWKERSAIWLAGGRRVGKTALVRIFPKLNSLTVNSIAFDA